MAAVRVLFVFGVIYRGIRACTRVRSLVAGLRVREWPFRRRGRRSAQPKHIVHWKLRHVRVAPESVCCRYRSKSRAKGSVRGIAPDATRNRRAARRFVQTPLLDQRVVTLLHFEAALDGLLQ